MERIRIVPQQPCAADGQPPAVYDAIIIATNRANIARVRHRPSLSDELSDVSVDSTIDLVVGIFDADDTSMEGTDAPLDNPMVNDGADGGIGHNDANVDLVDQPAAAPHNDDMGLPIAQVPNAEVNAIADDEINEPQLAAVTATRGTTRYVTPPPSNRSTSAVTATTAVAHPTNGTTSGIAPGDSELMPPRFSGDGKVDAHQWAKQFRNYLRMRQVTPEFAEMLLENRLTGTAAQWLENQPANLAIDDIITRFVRRFEINQGARNQLFAVFWTRRQGTNETARDYMEHMQTMARKLRLTDEALVVQGIIQGFVPEVQRDVVLQNPTTFEGLMIAAEIGERNAKLTKPPAAPAQPTTEMAAYQAQVNRLEATINTMQQLMVSNRTAAVATVNAVEAQQNLDEPSRQPPSYAGTTAPGQATFRARGRGRGLRGNGGQWQPRPLTRSQQPTGPYNRQPAPNRQPPAMQQQNGPATTNQTCAPGQPTVQQDTAAPVPQQQHQDLTAIWCGNCGRLHVPGHCRVTGLTCWYCSGVGHVQKCCPHLQAPRPPPLH